MAETKKTIKIFGHDTPVAEVPIKTAVENFNQYELEDGSLLRVKCVATSIVRVEGEFMPDGKPIYIVFTSPNTFVESSPLKQVTQ